MSYAPIVAAAGVIGLLYLYMVGLFVVVAFNTCPEHIRARYSPILRMVAAVYIGAKWPLLIYRAILQRRALL